LEYWGPKLESNRERDSRKAAALAAAGWRVVVVWQCELDDEFALVRRLSSLLVTGAEIVPLEFLSDSR